jgi:GH25 family lysozyme M1 (1,4-beta-N-acetylmuramidase)
MRTLGVDVSHWQRSIDWAKFYEGGVRFATVKVSQGNYMFDPAREEHLLGARKAGVLTGGFFWVDPIQSPQANVDKALDACVGLPVTYLCPDLEQWWADWAAWRAWRANPSNTPMPLRIAPDKLTDHAIRTCDYLAQKFDGVTFPYTSNSFIRGYMPKFATYMNGKKAYLAQYPWHPNRPVNMTWSQVRGALPPDTWEPAAPAGADVRFVQWSGDRVIAEGYSNVIDLDYFAGSEQEMLTWLTGGTMPPPVSKFPYKAMVTAGTLNVRSGPTITAQAEGPLKAGNQPLIYEESNGWGRITESPKHSWITLLHTRKV